MEVISSKRQDDWAFENGKEKLFWAENAVGRVYLTSPMSPLQVGYILKSTTVPREMDRIYDKLNAQEREHNEKFMEALYLRNREKYEATRSALMQKLGSGSTSPAEKNLIREALKLMDEKDSKMQKGSVTGVAAIQEEEAPIGPRTTRVM